ncbi:MAG TPA: gluconokinase [Rhodanobacteraceae bacterium]
MPMPGSHAPLLVVMGVSACGKSSVGAALAARLGVPFVDGDTLHPPENVARMAAGHPLQDADRWPWLAKVGSCLHDATSTGLVVACSALKRSYRDAILARAPATRFVFLEVPRTTLEGRLRRRRGHFMPASLLASQLADLEVPDADEPAVTVAATAGVAATVAAALRALAVRDA